jgi:hypothetical protein
MAWKQPSVSEARPGSALVFPGSFLAQGKLPGLGLGAPVKPAFGFAIAEINVCVLLPPGAKELLRRLVHGSSLNVQSRRVAAIAAI